ncbi:hypothetical protein [Streptomyces scopuliridis]|uniref:hypothetical protein n=1 Tax=Streptomyces scopuliridis TaxID=452529 RepID=UPI00341DE214
MPRTTAADAAIAQLSRTQCSLATTRQLRATGLAASTTSARCAPSGPWQRPLPGVVLIQTGAPDPRQRLLAAVLYADTETTPLSGTKAVLTGEAALALYGVRDAGTDRADVLVAARRGLRDRSYVHLRRTSRWPPTLLVDGIPCVRPVRAASDFAAHSGLSSKSRLPGGVRYARSRRCRDHPSTSSTGETLRLAIARTGRRRARPPGGRRYFEDRP